MRELACDRAAVRLNMAAISTYASNNSILREPVEKSQNPRRSILPVRRRRDVAIMLRRRSGNSRLHLSGRQYITCSD
jgi:hypothetical protein